MGRAPPHGAWEGRWHRQVLKRRSHRQFHPSPSGNSSTVAVNRDRAGPPLNTLLVIISLVFSCSLPPKQGRDTCVVEMWKRVCVLLYSVCVCACACLYSHIVIYFTCT